MRGLATGTLAETTFDHFALKTPDGGNVTLTQFNLRDVALGHILAAEKGRLGERYILGNADGNWTMQQTFATLTTPADPRNASLNLADGGRYPAPVVDHAAARQRCIKESHLVRAAAR